MREQDEQSNCSYFFVLLALLGSTAQVSGYQDDSERGAQAAYLSLRMTQTKKSVPPGSAPSVNAAPGQLSSAPKALEMEKVELEQRGSDLHQEIIRKYKVIVQDAKPNRQGVDIAPIIEKFIPEGTTFRDAQIILNRAGFDLSPYPPRPAINNPPPWYKDEYRYYISGTMTLDQGFGCKIWISLTISPDFPGSDDPKTKKITATIQYSAL